MLRESMRASILYVGDTLVAEAQRAERNVDHRIVYPPFRTNMRAGWDGRRGMSMPWLLYFINNPGALERQDQSLRTTFLATLVVAGVAIEPVFLDYFQARDEDGNLALLAPHEDPSMRGDQVDEDSSGDMNDESEADFADGANYFDNGVGSGRHEVPETDGDNEDSHDDTNVGGVPEAPPGIDPSLFKNTRQ